MEKMLAAVEKATRDAGDSLAGAKLVPAKALQAVPEMIAKEPDTFKKLAPGALLKFDDNGTLSYGAFPLGVEVLPAGANPKLPTMRQWSGNGSGKTVADLASMGVESWVPGVLSTGAAAGARASGLKGRLALC